MNTQHKPTKLIGLAITLVALTLNLVAQTPVNQKNASKTDITRSFLRTSKVHSMSLPHLESDSAATTSSKSGGASGTPTLMVNGTGSAGHFARWMDNNTLESSMISQSNNQIGIGTTSPTSKLTVDGKVESLSGGFKFPDGTIQTTAFKIPLIALLANSSPLIFVLNTGTGGAIQGETSNQGTAVSGVSLGGDGVIGSSTSGRGVFGRSSDSYGVYGQSQSQPAVYGINGLNGVETAAAAVQGEALAPHGVGVIGTGDGDGVVGITTNGDGAVGSSSHGKGVLASTDDGIALYSSSNSNGLAGQFTGDVQVSGTLTKGGGSFKIDHPLDPENKYLYHSFVESPDMMNIYNGNVTLDADGEAVVELPEWFGALNKEFRYLLTAIGTPGPSLYIAQKIAGNRFKIAGGQGGMEVSWQVTGIRQDRWANAHRIQVELDKSDKERGYYLHPELFNQSQEKSIEWALQPETMQRVKQLHEQMKQKSRANQ